MKLIGFLCASGTQRGQNFNTIQQWVGAGSFEKPLIILIQFKSLQWNSFLKESTSVFSNFSVFYFLR